MMASLRCLLLFVSALLLSSATAMAAEHLNMSTTAAKNGVSVIQCWQLKAPFASVPLEANGASLLTTSLGNLANGSYSILPAGTNLGKHVAPFNQ